MRMKLTCVVLLILVSVFNLQAQSASGVRAICLRQVGNIDHSIFPLAISDSEKGAALCQDELGLPRDAINPQIVKPATMTRFLEDLRTVTESQVEVPNKTSAFKFTVLQATGKREMILKRPTTHDLVKRLAQHCKGEELHKFLDYIERQTREPHNN